MISLKTIKGGPKPTWTTHTYLSRVSGDQGGWAHRRDGLPLHSRWPLACEHPSGCLEATIFALGKSLVRWTIPRLLYLKENDNTKWIELYKGCLCITLWLLSCLIAVICDLEDTVSHACMHTCLRICLCVIHPFPTLATMMIIPCMTGRYFIVHHVSYVKREQGETITLFLKVCYTKRVAFTTACHSGWYNE